MLDQETGKNFVKELRSFILRGNVVDLAVGVVVGGAFGKIVTSLVEDIMMPPLGLVLGRVNVSDLKFQLADSVATAAGKPAGPVSINYGNFLQNVVNFIIIALSVFLMVKFVSALIRKEKKNSKETEVDILKQILTELKEQREKRQERKSS